MSPERVRCTPNSYSGPLCAMRSTINAHRPSTPTICHQAPHPTASISSSSPRQSTSMRQACCSPTNAPCPVVRATSRTISACSPVPGCPLNPTTCRDAGPCDASQCSTAEQPMQAVSEPTRVSSAAAASHSRRAKRAQTHPRRPTKAAERSEGQPTRGAQPQHAERSEGKPTRGAQPKQAERSEGKPTRGAQPKQPSEAKANPPAAPNQNRPSKPKPTPPAPPNKTPRAKRSPPPPRRPPTAAERSEGAGGAGGGPPARGKRSAAAQHDEGETAC